MSRAAGSRAAEQQEDYIRRILDDLKRQINLKLLDEFMELEMLVEGAESNRSAGRVASRFLKEKT